LRPVQGLPLGSWPRSVGLSREGDGSEIVFTRLVHHIERVVPPPAGLRRGAGHRPGRGQRLPNLDVLSVLGRCPRAIDGSRWKPVATGPGGVQGERPSGIVLQLDIPGDDVDTVLLCMGDAEKLDPYTVVVLEAPVRRDEQVCDDHHRDHEKGQYAHRAPKDPRPHSAILSGSGRGGGSWKCPNTRAS